jgi:hypothetical protein
MPRWTVRWPKDAPGFHEIEIYEDVRDSLRYNEGHEAAWDVTSVERRAAMKCIWFAFRWNPGSSSSLRGRLHHPDICLPAAGWKQVADTGVRSYPTAHSFALPFRHFEFRAPGPENSEQWVAHTFYCLSEDRVLSPSSTGSELPQLAAPRLPHLRLTRNERIRLVLEGRRHLGQQVMLVVFVSGDEIPAESRFSELVREVILAQPGSQ